MNVSNPIDKLAIGPVHFAYSGWAFVNIFSESNPTPDENYFLIYDHPFSFEADAWLKQGKTPSFAVCIMNTGYSSGWCEESFGLPLVAVEIECRAKGDEHCRFIMAPPTKIEEHINRYTTKPQTVPTTEKTVNIPEFFGRKRVEEELAKYRQHLEVSVKERTAESSKTNKQLMQEIKERKLAKENLRGYQKKLRSLASELSSTEERERKRIAANLHDYIAQNLSICKMKLGELQKSASSADVAENLGKIKTIIEQANHYARSLMFEISPPVLYELGLKSALEWLIERVEDQSGISVLLEDDDNSKPLSDEVLILLFRAVRELLINVVKHGQTPQAAISVCKESKNIRIDIKDDGVGFDSAKIGTYGEGAGGFGLFNIRERLDYVGGRLLIKSQPGEGTAVTLLAPLMIDEGGAEVDEG